MEDYRKWKAHGYSWAYDETEDEGGAVVFSKFIPQRRERVDSVTERIYEQGYAVMRLFPEDLSGANFGLMARLNLTRTGRKA